MTSITGLTWLEGMTVIALGDGEIVFQGEVVNGTIALTGDPAIVHVGLPYTMTVKPMNPNVASTSGTSRGKKQKINRATLCFHETMFGKVGMDEDNLFDIPFPTTADPELYTGDITMDLQGEWADEATICITSEDPFPMTLKAIVPRFNVNED